MVFRLGKEGRMQLLIEEYGRFFIAVLLVTVSMSAGFAVLLQKWGEEGAVSDSRKTEFATEEGKRTPPRIYARDFKIRRGEPVSFENYVSAVDFDGSNLIDCLQADYEETIPGIRRYELSVKSPVTGKTARRKLVVLLDCPETGGDSLGCE